MTKLQELRTLKIEANEANLEYQKDDRRDDKCERTYDRVKAYGYKGLDGEEIQWPSWEWETANNQLQKSRLRKHLATKALLKGIGAALGHKKIEGRTQNDKTREIIN